MNLSGRIFCVGVFLAVACGCLLVESHNLCLTFCCCVLLMLNNLIMLHKHSKRKSIFNSKILPLIMVIFFVVMSAALIYLYEVAESLDYEVLKDFAGNNQKNYLVFVSVAGILLFFILLTGLVPLHFWLTETLADIYLPVFAFLMLIPIPASFAGLLELNIYFLMPMANQLRIFYVVIALLSMIVGAIGACSAKNLYKVFAYSSVCHFGIMLFVLRHFTMYTIDMSCVYLLTYLLPMYGICICLFGLKSKGEYLHMVSDLSGAAQKRPYISAMLTIYIFSLLGFPPFLGFIGLFSVLKVLAVYGIMQVAAVLFVYVILVYAYIQILQVMYFEKNSVLFDKVEASILIMIFINTILMFAICIKPYYPLSDFVFMVETAVR